MAAMQKRVQVTRSFRHRGEDIGIGSVLDLDVPLAQELRNARKVEFVASDTKVVTLPLKARERAQSPGDVLSSLVAQVAALTAVVKELVPGGKASKGSKEKESA